MFEILALVASLFVTPAYAQNPTCPTRPGSDTTNACASTAFVQKKTSAIYSIDSYGGDPTGTNDNVAAFNAVYAAAKVTGGIIQFGPGTYKFTNVPTITRDAIVLQCTGRSTVLQQTSTTGDMIKFNAAAPIIIYATPTGGGGGVDGTYNNVPMTGGNGTGATANITVTGGAVTAVVVANAGSNYQEGDVLSASGANIGNVTGFSVPVAVVAANAAYGGVRDCLFRPSVMTSGWQINAVNCYQCEFTNLAMQYAYNGIRITDSTEAKATNIELANMVGIRGLLYDGWYGTSFGFTLNHWVSSNPPPYCVEGAVIEQWTSGHTYSITRGAGYCHDYVYYNGYIFQALTAGVAGATPPVPPVVSDPAAFFTTPVSDGNLLWIPVSNYFVHILNDTNGISFRGNNVITLYGLYGFYADSTKSGAVPQFVAFNGLETDHTLSDGVHLTYGQDVKITNSFISIALAGEGVSVMPTFTSGFKITNSHITGNGFNGIHLYSSGGTFPVDTIIVGNEIKSNSISTWHNYNGIQVDTNVSEFIIANNMLGKDAGIGSTSQNWGVFVSNGTSRNYVISNNNCSGVGDNYSGCIYDSGTGLYKKIVGNSLQPAPTIAAGFCTSPAIAAQNGNEAFQITVGSACAAGTGTLTMPFPAGTGWVCKFTDITNPATHVIEQTGGTTTTVTVADYSRTTGAAQNMGSGDTIIGMCSSN